MFHGIVLFSFCVHLGRSEHGALLKPARSKACATEGIGEELE
jgi:hypothetical protein